MSAEPAIEFWFDFASTYSYLAAMRIDGLAEAAGAQVRWRPFLLGPIFAAQGWNTSPFNLYPAKGRHMWRDMEREADLLGLALRRPVPFPQNSVLAARVALVGENEGWRPAFCRALFQAQFARGLSIAEPAVLREVLADLQLDPDAVIEAAQAERNKDALREATQSAVDLGIFGAPSFTTRDGELFWGNDRLERALDWAVRRAAGPGR